QSKFRHFAAEVGFCFTIAMTQFLAEFLISGFAIVLPKLTAAGDPLGAGSLSSFWPATLLSLIMSATLLVFARLSDMHGGYPYFMFGVFWLAIWTLIPGFSKSVVVLDIARAMQGLAIAAFTPSTFAMVGSIYSEGPRRNFVLGLYGAMAPLGFFAGLLAGGGLDVEHAQWYNWVASILAFVVAVIAYLTVPADRTNRQKLDLKMDWIGAVLITSGLILLAYALAVEPYAGQMQGGKAGFGHAVVYGPFVSGCLCLVTAVYIEGWFAKCPLLPFDFFKPKSVKGFCFACLCFYACYGAWLYNSTDYFKSSAATGREHEIGGLELALWYTPTAIGGILFCVISGALLHIVPIKALLLLSGAAWIGAPLVLALCPTPLNYWSTVLPSTVCATLGIDLTFTVSIVFLSSVQPLRYQALAGAVCSILVNLAMSFGLPISEIVSQRADGLAVDLQHGLSNWKYKTTFIYAAASAGLGFIICLVFVNISRSVVSESVVEEDNSDGMSSRVSTLVEEVAKGQQPAPHNGTGKEALMYSSHEAV
ncbi:putative major facilitator superfamily transporter, partial [Polychaeton citri CBS 116435]